uniref:HSF-type DNA-binding domain-containing protein n=1 Tax=Scleropages formosus TaxID=113540 RepID=A0A8C9WV70_SCLFO
CARIPGPGGNFPAKLWRLVNDPHTDSVRWDQQGEGILIDRALFEAEVLGDLFKTNNFTSFIRQLNLYGFRKGGGRQDDEPDSPAELHFQNPYFKRDKPELLAHLRRMTRSNRAKLQAGLEVSCRRCGVLLHRHLIYSLVCRSQACWPYP